MLLLIDNYDSFTWNLRQYFEELGEQVFVYRNDEISVAEAEELNPNYLVISPGPGKPDNAGVSLPIIEHFAGKLPILGVCLGHQAIAQVFGGKISKAFQPMHGKQSRVFHQGAGLFNNLPTPLTVTRYHSLIVEPDSLPDQFAIDAWTENGNNGPFEVMAIRHLKLPLWGIQFHPESILTESGHQLLANFLLHA